MPLYFGIFTIHVLALAANRVHVLGTPSIHIDIVFSAIVYLFTTFWHVIMLFWNINRLWWLLVLSFQNLSVCLIHVIMVNVKQMDMVTLFVYAMLDILVPCVRVSRLLCNFILILGLGFHRNIILSWTRTRSWLNIHLVLSTGPSLYPQRSPRSKCSMYMYTICCTVQEYAYVCTSFALC